MNKLERTSHSRDSWNKADFTDRFVGELVGTMDIMNGLTHDLNILHNIDTHTETRNVNCGRIRSFTLPYIINSQNMEYVRITRTH